MADEPKFSAYQLILLSELSSLELEDELTPGNLVEVLRELATRLAELAEYYESEGTDELF